MCLLFVCVPHRRQRNAMFFLLGHQLSQRARRGHSSASGARARSLAIQLQFGGLSPAGWIVDRLANCILCSKLTSSPPSSSSSTPGERLSHDERGARGVLKETADNVVVVCATHRQRMPHRDPSSYDLSARVRRVRIHVTHQTHRIHACVHYIRKCERADYGRLSKRRLSRAR